MVKAAKLLAFCLVLVGCERETDGWPVWRGPRGDGIASGDGLLESWPEGGPRELWRWPLGVGFSGVTASGNLLFTAIGEGGREHCVALDAATGKGVWRRPLGPFLESSVGDGPRATPILDSGRVYAVGSQGDLWSFEAATGEPVWHVDLPKTFRGKNPIYGVASSPVIYKDLLLFNAGGEKGSSLVALDKETGKVRWATEDDPAAYSTPVVRKIAGREQAVFFTGRGAVGVDPGDGTLLWRFDWETPGNANVLSPIVHDDHVFLSSGYGTGAALIRIEKEGDGFRASEVWRNEDFESHFSSPILWKGHLYGFSGSELTALDFATGEPSWSQRGFQHGTVLGLDFGLNRGQMIVLGYKCALALVDLDPAAYRERSRAEPFARARCLTVPTLAGGRLILRNEREIVALDLTGELEP
jgi:outer membrane protein assembly factor BamB